MKQNYYFLVILLSIISSCQKESEIPTLPPITMEGKNIMACKINGELFISKGVPTYLNNLGVTFGRYLNSDNSRFYRIYANVNKPYHSISLYLYDYNSKDTLYFGGDANLNEAKYYNDVNYGNTYRTHSNVSGKLIILKDDIDIISGTFEFEAVNEWYDTVKVTEGRFDIKK